VPYLEITYEDGKLGKDDKIIKVDGKRIMFWELADMLITHCNIRECEELDPVDLINLINESLTQREVTRKILDKYYHTASEEDIAKIAVELYKNEEKIHSSPKERGGEFFRDFLNDCFQRGAVEDDILEQYNLRPKL